MSEYAVIAQNDESKWDDVKGDLYHYPSTYKNILTKGCKVIYYKGKMKKKEYLSLRLSPRLIRRNIISADWPNYPSG